MSRNMRLVFSIVAMCFLFTILSAGCAPETLIEKDFFVDSDAVIKEVPFGTPLSLDGLIVKVQMTNGTFVTLPRGGEGYTVDDHGYEKETPGTYTIVISYKNFVTASFKITILEEEIIDENDDSDIVVTGIAVKQNVGKRLFLFGEPFSTEGIVVERFFSNDTTQRLDPQQYELNSQSFKSDESGSYDIQVRYTDGQKTFSDVYTVVVTPEIATVLTKITLKTAEVKKQYLFGEDFLPDGLMVEKWYSTDGVVVTEYASADEYSVNLSGYKKNVLGESEITIVIKDAPNISASFKVKINDYLASVTAFQNRTIFDLGDEFSIEDGLTVYEHMASGARVDADLQDYTVDSSSFDPSTVGEYTIRVYQINNPDMSAEYTVQVMDIPDL